MIHQRSSPVLLRHLLCSVFCSLLALHSAIAETLLEAGSRCGVPDATCREGLVCVSETPGSTVKICRDSNRTPCDTEQCPRVWCGPNLQYVPESECCPVCPPLPTIHTPTTTTSPTGCSENGIHHQEGETWERDSCTSCTCEAGVPLCTSIQCYVPDNCEELVLNLGQCCPTCVSIAAPQPAAPQCVEDGQTHEEGESWSHNGDPCTTCFCADGEVLCVSRSCYVECENPQYLPDTCCPICPADLQVPVATSLPPPPPLSIVLVSPPTYCEDSGQIYENGATWNPNGDPCTSCQCEEGLTLCLARACFAECESADQVFLPGVCCPLCPGDEGYPTSGPAPTSRPTPAVTESISVPSTATSDIAPTPTPLPPSAETTTTSAPTITTPTSELPSAATTTTTAATCKDDNGAEQPDGASWCPLPHEKATCVSGIISLTEHHCPELNCQAQRWTPGSCDCPVCPDGELETVVVSAVLDMEYSHYLTDGDSVQKQLREALAGLGLEVVDIRAESYGLKQTQIIISLSSMSGDKILLEDLEALLLEQLKSPSVMSIKVGHHEEPKSINGVSRPLVRQSSSSSGSGGADKTAIIVAVTLTVVVALVGAIVIMVIVTRARRMTPIPKTTTV